MKQALVIDDDRRIREFIGCILRDDGFQVYEAEDGLKGLRLMADRPGPDIVVTDILMPNSDGVDVIRTLRRTKPATQILAISGGGMIPSSEYLEIASLLGAHAVLAKPFSSKQLVLKVHELLAAQAPAALM